VVDITIENFFKHLSITGEVSVIDEVTCSDAAYSLGHAVAVTIVDDSDSSTILLGAVVLEEV
jgi:hypothetical protein